MPGRGCVRVHARISVAVGPGPVSSAGLPAQGTAAQVQTAQVPSARLLALVMAARCRRRWLWLRWGSHGPGAGGPDAGAEPAWELLEHPFFCFCLKQKTNLGHNMVRFTALSFCSECKHCSCCLVAGYCYVWGMHVLGVFGNLSYSSRRVKVSLKL